jgi:hypothetical protein
MNPAAPVTATRLIPVTAEERRSSEFLALFVRFLQAVRLR